MQLKKVEFWPTDPIPRVGGGCERVAGRGLRAKYLLPCFCSLDSLKFDMQHDHVLKKLNFDLLNPSRGSWGRGVCGQNICYHVAALLILLNLICIWPCSEKVEFWTTDPIPRVWGGVFSQNICYHVATFLFLILYNLICNMTVLWFFLLTPPPKSTQGVRHRPSIKNHVWYVSYLLHLCLQAKFA